MNPIQTFFSSSKNPLVLCGAMGTELQRRGYETKLPLWSALANIESPELVQQIHQDYLLAGAQILTTNTFRTSRYTFEKIQKPDLAASAVANAVMSAKNAQMAVAIDSLIAGSVAPLEDCYQPEDVPADAVLRKYHREHIRQLKENGVDLIFGETFNCIREAKIVSQICREEKIAFCVSFVPNKAGNLLSGEPLEQAIMTVERYQPLAILLNCRPPQDMEKALCKLLKHSKGPTGIYANGIGNPADNCGWNFDGGTEIEIYLDYCDQWIRQGVSIIGSCCGSTPEYTRMIGRLVKTGAAQEPRCAESSII